MGCCGGQRAFVKALLLSPCLNTVYILTCAKQGANKISIRPKSAGSSASLFGKMGMKAVSNGFQLDTGNCWKYFNWSDLQLF